MRTRFISGLAAALFFVPVLSGAVLNFDGLTNGAYDGGVDKNVDDLSALGSDSLSWGVRSYDGTNGNDITNGDNGRVIPNNWEGKLFVRPTVNGDADLSNDIVFDLASIDIVRRWDDADCVITGYKPDGSEISTSVLTTGTLTATLSGFTGLKEARVDFAGGTNSAYAFVDNVVYSVPEPTSLALLGLSGVMFMRRRSR